MEPYSPEGRGGGVSQRASSAVASQPGELSSTRRANAEFFFFSFRMKWYMRGLNKACSFCSTRKHFFFMTVLRKNATGVLQSSEKTGLGWIRFHNWSVFISRKHSLRSVFHEICEDLLEVIVNWISLRFGLFVRQNKAIWRRCDWCLISEFEGMKSRFCWSQFLDVFVIEERLSFQGWEIKASPTITGQHCAHTHITPTNIVFFSDIWIFPSVICGYWGKWGLKRSAMMYKLCY